MVCKEDVLLWFKDLEGYQRIDVLCELLKMCLPFEVRFLGSCVEEIGKQTYQELHGETVNANDLDKMVKDPTFAHAAGVYNEKVRHKVLIYLSLLNSKNYSVAEWLYRKVLRTERAVVDESLLWKDSHLLNEFLLLYVMALYHPAFTFKQRFYFHEILLQFLDYRENKHRTNAQLCYPPGFGYPAVKTFNPMDIPMVPVKAHMTVSCEEMLQQQHPPGFHHSVPPPPMHHPPQEFVTWNSPGLPCGGASEIPPPFSASPLVNESPNQSRSGSPHQPIITLRSQNFVEPNFPAFYGSDVKEEELHPVQVDGKAVLPEGQWLPKQHNGLRFIPPPPLPPTSKMQQQQRPFVLEAHFQNMSIEQENSRQSNNSSSSNSSLSHTPPETPRTNEMKTCASNRVNGLAAPPPPPSTSGVALKPPPSQTASTGAVDVTASPPPAPPPANLYNSVPSYPAANFPPIRTVFPAYTQTYRPPFPPVHYQPTTTVATNENSMQPAYTIPYNMSFMFPNPHHFATAAPPAHPPTNCYNCGAMGHGGTECTNANIEDMTQQKSYTIEYTAPPPPLPPDASSAATNK